MSGVVERADIDVANAQLTLDHCRRRRDQIQDDLARADRTVGDAQEALEDARTWAAKVRSMAKTKGQP